MTMILIAIGANLPVPGDATPLETCRAAVRRVAVLPGCRLVAISDWYASAPVPPSGQPDYVNGVARLEGEPEPARLLEALHAIEAAFGRTRGAANAARTLDLDIVAIGDTLRDRPDPVLPHPRAHQRAFVLEPLGDVAPGWRHPRSGESLSVLRARAAGQAIRWLAPGTFTADGTAEPA